MKIGIMQPYFLPYLGYFQLIAATNQFILHDDLQYTKKGWLNRNRFLMNGQSNLFTVSIKKTAYTDMIGVKEISQQFCRKSLLRKFFSAYRNAPYFKKNFPTVEAIVLFKDDLLFGYTKHSISSLCQLLEIKSKLSPSSTLSLNNNLKGESRVISVCKKIGATSYINPLSGQDLYSKEKFEEHDIRLQFLAPKSLKYNQFKNHFVPNLSIVDALMFNETSRLVEFCNTGFVIT